MKRAIKNLAAIFMCLCMILAMSLTIEAKYVPKQMRCSRCYTLCTSYGYDSNYGGVTQTQNAGNYCPVCKKIVPAGEVHMYMWDFDRYYFLCESSSCQHRNYQDRLFYYDYNQPVSEHYTNGIRDF